MSSRRTPASIIRGVMRRLRAAVERRFGPRVKSVRNYDNQQFPGLFKPDLPQDADSLLRHFATRVAADWPQLPDELTDLRINLSRVSDAEIIDKADAALANDIHPSGIRPGMTTHGSIDWSHNPSESKEWLLMLHRHAWWPLWGAAYQRTGDEKYAEAFVAQLLDWINSNPMPGQKNEGVASWRLMEAGLRMRISWIPCFGCFFDSPAFDRAAKLSMLKVICDHGRFLHGFHTNRNHLVRESNGLLATGLSFDEFKEAEDWVAAAAARLEAELRSQVNRDGSHLEMSVGYQWLTVVEFEVTRSLLQRYGKASVIKDLDLTLRQMYEFLAAVIRPDQSFPQLNDGFILWDAQRLHEVARGSGWNDIEYIASSGSSGQEPEFCSRSYPNAGLHIMRSDWTSDARYLIADTGPYGGPHGHEDKLSFEAFAYGAPFIVDPGSYTYDGRDKFRNYFVSSAGHNTVLVDGMSQIRRWSDQHMTPVVQEVDHGRWSSNKVCDFASGRYDEGYANFALLRPSGASSDCDVEHRRDFLFAKPDYWIIVDRLNAAERHDYSFLFHLAPDVVVDSLDAATAILSVPAVGATMLLQAISNEAMDATIRTGEEAPIQGWFSPDHHKKCPSHTLEFTVKDAASSCIAWLLYPLPPGDDAAGVQVSVSEQIEQHGIEFVVAHREVQDTITVNADTSIRRRDGLSWTSADSAV